VIFIDNVLGSYFRPESGIRTIVGVPCQDWDLDPEAPAVLPAGAPAVGAQILTHRIPAMEGATLARGYRAFDCYSRDRHAILGRVDGIDASISRPRSAAPASRSLPRSGVHGRADRGRPRQDRGHRGIRSPAVRRGEIARGAYPYAPRNDHADPRS